MEANVRALRLRKPDSPALLRYAEVAQILTGSADAKAGDGIRQLAALGAALGIPPLSKWGVTAGMVAELVEKSKGASSMKGNPIQLAGSELTDLIQKAL